MILKELNLISFGKFEKERLDFEDGLNIIYGDNESGKTTIHNFIDGMFYGFLKPYARKRNYLEEYKKYRPWNRQEYSGILKLDNKEKIYRIERDFLKGEAKVYDDLTGEDITKHIDTGEKVKVHLPGIYFFDFNNTVYKNTISIKQLGNKIDSSLSKEVKDRLANISTSLDDDISVRNALGNLEKQLKDIGTERAYTSPYGRAKEKLNKLENHKKQTLQKQIEYNGYIDESYILRERIEKEKDKINKLQIRFEKAQILEKKKTYEEGLKTKEDLKRIDEEIDNLKNYSGLSFDDYTKALRLESNKEYLSREIRDLKEKLNSIEEKLKNIKVEDDEGIIEGIKAEGLYEDRSSYDEIEDEKNNLILNSQQNRLEILNSEYKTMIAKDEKSKISMIITILLTMAFVGLGFINHFLIILALPLGVIAFYFQKIRNKFKKEIKDLDLKIKEIKVEENRKQERINLIENQQKQILLKYNCSSKAELNRLYDKISVYHMSQTNRIGEISELNQKKEQTISILEVKRNEEKKLVEDLNVLISNNNSENLEEFKDGLEKKRIYDDLIKDKESKNQVLGNILDNINLDELKDELDNYNDEYFKDNDKIDKVKVINEIKDKEEILSTMNDNNARLEERIHNLNKEVKKLVEIEEEIDRLKNLIKNFDNRIEAIELARDTIENISQDIHNQFAPAINRDVSQIMDMVTDGKYDQVKVNDDLNISVENPITKEIIDIDGLSGGTIDQLYFALRFSIISSIKGDNLPLILDDCFIQYDNVRLKNILKVLSKISDEKQILLFTCHHREKELLDNLGLKYNLINLT